MTHSSLLQTRRLSVIPRGVVVVLAGLVVASCTAPVMTACASSTTRIDGAKTNATHETRSERPGRVIERKIELRIPAPGPKTAPDATVPESARSPVLAPVVMRAVSLASMPVLATINPQPARSPLGDRAMIRDAIDSVRDSGQPIELVITETETIPLSADTSKSELTDDGASLATSSDDAAVDFEGRQGRWQLPWATKRGGGGSFGISAQVFGDSGVNALHIIGALVVLAAIIPLVMMPRRVGLSVTLGGVGLMLIAAGTVAEEYPWILAIALVLFVAALFYLAYEAWRSGRRGITLTGVSRAIEFSKNADEVKANVAREAGKNADAIKAEIKAAKKRGNVNNTPPTPGPASE